MSKEFDEILNQLLTAQLNTYSASSLTLLGSGIDNFAIPAGKFNSVTCIDILKQSIVVPKLSQSDLLIINLLIEKMGYDFFINIIGKVRPQYICCSFINESSSHIQEDILTNRLLDSSYDLFSRNEISLPGGKVLISLDFIVASPTLGILEPSKSSYKVKDKELVSLSVYNVGYQKCEPLYQWGPGIRDHYLIHYIISGSGTYVAAGHEYHLNAGDCFLAYPNTEISYYADSDNPWEYAWIGFNGSDAGLILNSTSFTQNTPYILSTVHGEQISDHILHIYEARGNSFSKAILMTGRLYELLALLVEDSKKESLPSTSQLYVQKAIEYIDANYSYPITIEDIAAFVGISRSQLFRCFEIVLNKSPKEYLSDFRIKQACQLLVESNHSITSIANSLGFDNSLYFSKAFKKAKNMSPSQYREQYKRVF